MKEHRLLVGRIVLFNFVVLWVCLCMVPIKYKHDAAHFRWSEQIHARYCVAAIPPQQEERVPRLEVYYQNEFAFWGPVGYFYPPGYVIIADNMPCE